MAKFSYFVLFTPQERNITAPFYIVSQVSLQVDFLIGFPTMRDNFINIFPAQNQISQRDTLIPALSPATPPSPSFGGVVLFVTRDDVMLDIEPPFDVCVTSDKQIWLAEPLILVEFDLSVVTASIPSAAPGTNMLCLS